MKKLSFIILSFIISASNNIFAQILSGACQHKEITRELCQAADTIARFMDDIKKNATGGAWEQFVRDAGSGLVAAFDNFGERSKELKETFTTLGTDLDRNALSLIKAVDPEERLSVDQLQNEVTSLIICYYDDPEENDLKKLIKESGGPVPDRLDGGPCDIAMRSCLTSAASTHTSQLMSCGFGAGGIWRWLGGWWGAGTGLVCLLAVENTYNNAKWTCFENYCDCIHCQ